jgi:hypothetical protein
LSNKDENADSDDWLVELIPNGDTIYRRAHKQKFNKNGEAQPAAFELVGGMSTDWEKYSTAQQARQRAAKPFVNGVVSLKVKDVRDISSLTVDHSPIQRESKLTDAKGNPIPPNRAHTDVNGPNTTELRDKLSKIAKLEILPESDL